MSTGLKSALDSHHAGLHDAAVAVGIDPKVIFDFINEFVRIAPTVVPIVVNVINFIIGLLPKKA